MDPPPYIQLASTWHHSCDKCSQPFPIFDHSSASMYYTERKPKSKSGEALGMRLHASHQLSTSDLWMCVALCSPFCLLVPRLTNVVVCLKASFSTTGDGNCGCDLMVARCDVYCCCDRDCTQVDIEGFQCSSTRYCVYSLVSWPLPTRCVHAGTDSMAPQF